MSAIAISDFFVTRNINPLCQKGKAPYIYQRGREYIMLLPVQLD